MFILYFFCFLCIFSSEAQVSGIKTIPGSYSSIGAALADIQSSGLSGHVILELQQNYNWQNETYPIVVPESFPTAANATVTIRPRIGAVDIHIGTDFSGGVVPSTGDIPIFDIYGSWFNIDGRPAGGGTISQLFIWSNAQEGTAVQFSNNASNNNISYCHLKGNNYYTAPFGAPLYRKGVVTFNPAGPFPIGVLGGIHDNTIAHNIIEGAIYGGGAIPPTIVSPYYAIYANGNPNGPNINNKITDNDIINFTYSGIEIRPDGPGAGWIIKNNHFYSTLLDYTYPDYAIDIFHTDFRAGTNIIEGNYIGGNARFAAGKWKGGPFLGIVCGTYYAGDSVSVRNNVIKNMEKINPDPYPSSCSNCDRLAAISITNSRGSNKVYCTGNFIGGDAADYGVNISAPAAGGNSDFYGILYNNCSGGAITQNTIQKITVSSVVKTNFIGIKALVLNNVTISDNLIQDVSLQSNTEVNFFGVMLIDDDPELFTCEPFSTPVVVENNTVQNINVVQPFDITKFDGLLFQAENVTANRNRVGSTTQSNSISITGGNTAIVNAMRIVGTPQNVSIKNSTIANVTAGGATSAVVNGIDFNGAGTVALSGNTINNLSSTTIRGIYLEPLSGNSSATVNNNTIVGTGSSAGTGIQANVPTGATLNLVANANTVNNWQTGFNMMAAAGSTLTQTVQSNYVTGNQTGYVNNASSPQNATCNWWGSASGPSGSGPGTGDPVGPNVTFTPWATVPTFVAVDAGADQTIYIGYGPTSKTINPVYTVCGAPSYLWSTGATTASITVSPTVTTTYSVTITDANNHSATDNVTIVVKDIRCGTNKVKVCHKESNTKKKTTCINTSDVPNHLAHGDALGDCPVARGFSSPEEMNIDIEKPFAVYPNPADGFIQLQWSAKENGNTFIHIYDVMGRTVLQLTITEVKGVNNRQLLLKDIPDGNYILVMRSGGELKTQRFTVQH